MQNWDQLKRPSYVRSLVAMLGGTLFAIVLRFVVPFTQLHRSVMDRGQPPSGGAPAFLLLWRIENVFLLAGSWPWSGLVLLYFGWMVIRLRNRDDGWVLSFLVGCILVTTLSQLMQKL